jgi:hypothetical protein
MAVFLDDAAGPVAGELILQGFGFAGPLERGSEASLPILPRD